MIEWLLSVSPAQLSQGRLVLEGGWADWLILSLGAALVSHWLINHQLAGLLARRQRRLLWSLRTALLALLALLLLDPVLIAESEEPVRGEVALLLDDTLSMRLDDLADGTRADFVVRNFAPDQGIAREIGQGSTVRHWRFAADLQPLTPGQDLTFSGNRSHLAAALEQLARHQDIRHIVLVSDGRLDDPAELETALQRLRASAITVHTVAVGDQRPGVDLGISAVTLPDSVLKDATVTARVTLSQRGLAGREIELVVEEDSAIVAQRTLNLPQDDRQPTVDIPLTFTVPGPRRLDFRVGVAAEESLTDNNRLTRLVRVRGDPLQVLHIEGEPRFEVRFLRRAVADDDAIRLASLVRTAEQKYYRLGITGPQELARGLPIDEAQLFPFEVLVLGSADATLVDSAQQRLIRDFVARRGGGLLLLGGSGALAEGGFGGTPLADLLPVVLEEPQQDYRVQVPIRPTEEGRHDPLLQAALPLAPREIEALPALTVVNPLRRAKPGARVLLEADDGTAAPLIVLAYQRYGRGAVATLAVRNTWRWQMQLPLADQTHETLWRALLRGLGEWVPKPIEVSLSPTSAVPGESVTVTAEVLDAGFRPLDGGNPTLTVTTPLGEMETLPLKAVPSVIGRYRAGFTATQNGRYDLRVAQGQAQEAQQTEAYLWVDSAGAEFRNPAVAVELLARIARTTGGRILHPEEIAQLPELLESTRTTRTVIRRLELWDAPLFLVALLSLIGCEWFYRRQCALA